MSTFACDPEFRRSLEALLSDRAERANGRRQQALETLSSYLEPGETLLAYAGRPPLDRAEVDAFSYTPGSTAEQTDVFHYVRREAAPQTDVFAYDLERARRVPDVMGYARGGRPEDTDVFAYARPEPTPDNDAFMAPGSAHPALRFVLLTDRRLIGAVVHDRAVVFSSAPVKGAGAERTTDSSWVRAGWMLAD